MSPEYELIIPFENSINEAIQLSLSQSRPLFIYIVDPATPPEQSAEWELQRLPNSTETDENQCQLSMEVQQFLIDKTVNLKIVKDSVDFVNFVSAFPQFQAKFPCAYFIMGGKIIDCILGFVEVPEFESRLLKVIREVEQIQSQSQTNTPTHTPTPTPSTSQVPVQSPQPHAHASTPVTSSSASPANQQPKSNSTDPKRKYKSLKEESAELASRKYRENLIKQNKLDKEEKDRILRLLKADQLERRNQIRNKMNSEQNDELKETQDIHENLHNEKIDSSKIYVIQIKLFDGASMRCSLDREKKLEDVREYISANHKEYLNSEYLFYKPLDRLTYSRELEQEKLSDLHLNRATLILKPIEGKSSTGDHNTSFGQDAHNEGGLLWVKNKISGLFNWGATPSTSLGQRTQQHESSPALQTENQNSFEPDEDIDDSSETESIRTSTSHKFDQFYTPTALISRTASPLNPNTLNLSSHHFSIPNEHSDNAIGAGLPSSVSAIPGDKEKPELNVLLKPPALISSTSSSSRIRTMIDDWSGADEEVNMGDTGVGLAGEAEVSIAELAKKKKEKKKVYNGNFTNLEDDKKKDEK